MNPEENISLGASSGSRAIEAILDKEVEGLKRTEDKVDTIDASDALLLLTRCLTLPRLTCFLRASPSVNSGRSREHHETIKFSFNKAQNLRPDDSQWKQATPHVRHKWHRDPRCLPDRHSCTLVFRCSLQKAGILHAARSSSELCG